MARTLRVTGEKVVRQLGCPNMRVDLEQKFNLLEADAIVVQTVLALVRKHPGVEDVEHEGDGTVVVRSSSEAQFNDLCGLIPAYFAEAVRARTATVG